MAATSDKYTWSEDDVTLYITEDDGSKKSLKDPVELKKVVDMDDETNESF